MGRKKRPETCKHDGFSHDAHLPCPVSEPDPPLAGRDMLPTVGPYRDSDRDPTALINQKLAEIDAADRAAPIATVVLDPTTGEPLRPITQGWPAPRKPKAAGMIDPTTGEPVRPIEQGWPGARETGTVQFAPSWHGGPVSSTPRDPNDESFTGHCPTCGQECLSPRVQELEARLAELEGRRAEAL